MPSSVASRRLRSTCVFLCVIVVGLFARIWIVEESLGSNDIVTWKRCVKEINRHGLGAVYDDDEVFNHPPLMAHVVRWLYVAATSSGVRFEVVFKAPMLLADLGTAALIYWSWRRRSAQYAAVAAALFWWSPASILVSAYHGNTDSLCVALALAALLAADNQRPLLAGLALAASINVKLIPVLLIPVLYSCTGRWRSAARLTVGLSFGVLPFIPYALWHWQGFAAHVLSYRSYPGHWGVTYILSVLNTTPNVRELVNPRLLNDFWVQRGFLFVLLAPLVLGALNLVRGRPWSARELGACVFGAFLVLAPGFGIQYIAYPAVLLFAANLTRAVVFSTIGGLYAFLLYYSFWTHSRPFFSTFDVIFPAGAQLAGYLAWLVLIPTVADLLRAKRQPPALLTATA